MESGTPGGQGNGIRIASSVGSGLLSLAIILALWGFDRAASLFANPARAFVVCLMCLWAVAAPWMNREPVMKRGREDRFVRERWFFPLLFPISALVFVAPFFDGRTLWSLPGGDMVRWLGVALYIPGLVLAAWSQWHMGRYFSGYVTLQPGHRLVTDGPFALVRHPRYLGMSLNFIGYACAFRSTLSLGAAFVATAMFVSRVPREERLLSAEFQEEWTSYARRVRRIIPWVY